MLLIDDDDIDVVPVEHFVRCFLIPRKALSNGTHKPHFFLAL